MLLCSFLHNNTKNKCLKCLSRWTSRWRFYDILRLFFILPTSEKERTEWDYSSSFQLTTSESLPWIFLPILMVNQCVASWKKPKKMSIKYNLDFQYSQTSNATWRPCDTNDFESIHPMEESKKRIVIYSSFSSYVDKREKGAEWKKESIV